jgi:SAM-dependent methyltransferase
VRDVGKSAPDAATLSPTEARRVYDRIGRTQDTQAFYEDRATSELVAHLDLATAHAVFEFGCGTGRFAASLLSNHLPADAIYRAVDLSPVMVALAERRLAAFGSRAEVRLSDGGPPSDQPSGFYDRFVSNFVLDLLSLDDIARVMHEAHRILRPGGLLGLASLTTGFTPASRALGWLWARLHAFKPALVGGCRALELAKLLPESEWEVRHQARVAPLGIALEAVVALRK